MITDLHLGETPQNGDLLHLTGLHAQLNAMPFNEQYTSLKSMQPIYANSNWLNGFAITEASGAILGGAAGAAVGYGAGAYYGFFGRLLFNVPASAIGTAVRQTSLLGGGYGAVTGLAVAGIGYLGYRGIASALEESSTDKSPAA
jgi:hypothetical protein